MACYMVLDSPNRNNHPGSVFTPTRLDMILHITDTPFMGIHILRTRDDIDFRSRGA